MRLIRRPRCLLPSVAFSQRHKLPKSPGVYYVMRGWKPLYIGLSKDINLRWTSQSKPHHKLSTFYGKPLIRLHYQLLPLNLIGNFEAAEIKRYKPPHNNREESIVPSAAWSFYCAQCFLIDSVLMAAIASPLILMLQP